MSLQAKHPGEDIDARLIEALDRLQAKPKNDKWERFLKFYPTIIRALSRKVTQKAILEEMKEYGLNITPAKFKDFKKMADAASETVASAVPGVEGK